MDCLDGSAAWREAYAGRTRELALVLTSGRCRQVVWVLQPGFERRDAMACHRELINEVQRQSLRLERTRVLELATSEAAYGPDQTHFNRAFVLQLGPALFHLVDTSGQMIHRGCLVCHGDTRALKREPEILPLRSTGREPAISVWAPERIGVQCRIAVTKRVTDRVARKVAHRRRMPTKARRTRTGALLVAPRVADRESDGQGIMGIAFRAQFYAG